MNNVSIIRRKLTKTEAAELIEETKFSPDLVYVSSSHWLKFARPYCILVGENFAGACAISNHSGWIKIGPLVLKEQYRQKGMGKKIIQHVISDNKDAALFITSSNKAVQRIVEALGFEEIAGIFFLPKKVYLSFLYKLIDYLNLYLIVESIRKKIVFQRGKRRFYVKEL